MATSTQNDVLVNAGIKRNKQDYNSIEETNLDLPEEIDMSNTQSDFSFKDTASSGLSRMWDGASNFLSNAFGSSADANGITTGNVNSSGLSGISLQGVGAVTQGIGSVWDAYNKKQYQDEIVGMEKERVNREVARQTKAQAALDSAWV